MHIRDVRKLYDIYDVVGAEDRRKVILCPLPGHVHHNHTPSFSIYTGRDQVQRFECHGSCGKRGDVIDLVGYLEIPGYDDKDYDQVAMAVSLLQSGYQLRLPTPEKPSVLSPARHLAYLPPGEEAIAYGATRGLMADTLRLFQVGQDRSWFTIPAFKFGQLFAIKKRSMLDSPQVRYMAEKGSTNGIFNHDQVYLARETVFLLKGEIPVMLFAQYGFKACSLIGGESSWDEALPGVLSLADKIVIVGDNDEAGRVSVARRLLRFRNKTDVLFPPAEFKDIDAWLLADEHNALRAIRDKMSV
jgi:DNA primase